jgi:hypothetical protein
VGRDHLRARRTRRGAPRRLGDRADHEGRRRPLGARREFLRTLRRVAPDAALVEVPYPNNRVELFYYSSERRSEVLRGGIPGWTWLGLAPLLADVDALYVNLISASSWI